MRVVGHIVQFQTVVWDARECSSDTGLYPTNFWYGEHSDCNLGCWFTVESFKIQNLYWGFCVYFGEVGSSPEMQYKYIYTFFIGSLEM